MTTKALVSESAAKIIEMVKNSQIRGKRNLFHSHFTPTHTVFSVNESGQAQDVVGLMDAPMYHFYFDQLVCERCGPVQRSLLNNEYAYPQLHCPRCNDVVLKYTLSDLPSVTDIEE